MHKNIFIALVHYPVYNKKGEVVVTSITTLDIHDIARTARTYGIAKFYVLSPLPAQKELAQRILNHWREGYGAEYNPTRREAFLNVSVAGGLAEVIEDIKKITGKTPKTIATDARKFPDSISFNGLRTELTKSNTFLFLFGTGWGLEKGIMDSADYRLEPVEGITDYNHLPVRGAIAIILDRLLGRK
ncbi:MAG: RNA methyltransferase [Nitrospinae bacterium]|nr:RNA methyltransferase [Nitrospinota bacterium]